MDELVISRNSKLYHIAEFGGFRASVRGFNGYTEIPSSSCTFIRSLILGSFAILGLIMMAIGMLQCMILGLIHLGLPAVTKGIMGINWLFSVFALLGIFGWCLVCIVSLAATIVWFINHVWPHISEVAKGIIWRAVKVITPNEDIRRHAKDYLDKICKPVKITE